MNFKLASGQSGALLIRSHPLRIGEGFELSCSEHCKGFESLNPLRIGEGFELSLINYDATLTCLNPLRIGEGFERNDGI